MTELETVRWRAHAHVDKWDQDQTDWVTGRLGLREPPQARHFSLLRVRPYGTAEAGTRPAAPHLTPAPTP